MISDSETEIFQISPRSTVEIHLPDDRVLSGPRNSPVGEFLSLLPEAVLRVDHSVSSGGYYCQVLGKPGTEYSHSLNSEELSNLENEMHRLVESNLPFIRSEMPLPQAIDYFQNKGKDEKVRLLAHRQKSYL